MSIYNSLSLSISDVILCMHCMVFVISQFMEEIYSVAVCTNICVRTNMLLGGYRPPKHDVQITIVQVKTKATNSSEKREPVRVAPVDCVTRFIHHEEAVDARCCFAL